MPVTIDELVDTHSPGVAVSLDICARILRDSAGASANGNPNPGHADMHQLDDGFGHFDWEYRVREQHSVFASPQDAAIALYSVLISAAARFVLLKMKLGRNERMTIFSVAEPGATMRITMAALPGMPVAFDYTMANVRLVMDVDNATRRLHVQTFFPVKNLDRELRQAFGGGVVTQAVAWGGRVRYYNGDRVLGEKSPNTANVNLNQYTNLLR
ncbi:hypothetical protein [Belnapia rosea]|uniref:Uncharacterized protein n=1 Tax=Belnapia rosea TaxID=938405 RepID=A0A1G6LKY1_9PROT|nr:hypothetical protein [Belnapia rosea]SDC43982.1 hypothetical protein SAMN04487779_1001935 [Belnapia rosea]